MEKREQYFLENACIITSKEYDEMEQEWQEEPQYNSSYFDVTIDGIIMYFDGLETFEDFKNYINVYENTAYKIVNENDEGIGFAFHSII